MAWAQVDEWSAELVEIEELAKEGAQLLFFVFDNETRGIGSMVETAYLAARGRCLVVTIKEFEDPAVVDNRRLNPGELADLCRGRDFLRALIHQEGIPLFDDIESAVAFAIQQLHTGHRSLPEDSAHGVAPAPAGPAGSLRCILDNARSIFQQYGSAGACGHLHTGVVQSGVRAAPLVRVKAKFTVKNAVGRCKTLSHTG